MPGVEHRHGHGYGHGYGSSYGSGHGYGYGKPIDGIDGYTVKVLTPWPVVQIGCRALTLDEWEECWREVAKEEGVDITESRASEIIASAREKLND